MSAIEAMKFRERMLPRSYHVQRAYYRQQMRLNALRWKEAVQFGQWETAMHALCCAIYFRGLSGGAA